MRDSSRRRLDEILDAATLLFIERGYRRTRLDEVARAVGLTGPALYRYVESKEALFDLVVRRAAPDAPLGVDRLPVPGPPPGATLARLESYLARAGRVEALERALADPGADAGAELEAIIREVFDLAHRYRVGTLLMNACAVDWPELAAVWNANVRAITHEKMSRFLASRMERGDLRRVAEPDLGASALGALITAGAVYDEHMPWLGDGADRPETVRECIVAHAVAAYLPGRAGSTPVISGG